MNKESRIYIAGHRGLVGSAIYKRLIQDGYTNLIVRTSDELDLRDRTQVESFFAENKIDYVFFTAAKAGGVLELSTHPVESMSYNLRMQDNIMFCSFMTKVKKLLFVASNCIYPKLAVQPLKEEFITAGKLEPTTEYYAIAKIAGLKMCQAYRKQYGCNFITGIPVNLYGENDKYHPDKSHVMPALLKKFKEAAESVEVWGTGNARREFMHSEDVADACIFLMQHYNESEPVNISTGCDISIRDLAYTIKEVVDFKGEIRFNFEKPEGTMGKVLDPSKINKMGWFPKIALRDGIKRVYESL